MTTKPRTRNRKTARDAGTRFETQITRHLAETLNDDRIVRRARTGAKDRGDISGLRAHGQRVAIEVKNTTRTQLSEWIRQAHIEAGNDDALLGVVIHKRHGQADPGAQYATMTVNDLIALICGERPDSDL